MINTHSLSALASVLLFATHFIDIESYEIPEKVYYEPSLTETLFQSFKSEYQKKYETEEEKYRFQVFSENLERINQLNEAHELTVFGLNTFSDLTPNEFRKMLSGARNASAVELIEIPVGNVPDELDYRKNNLVTEIKYQGQCGSDYIFSAMGEIEGQYAKKHNKTILLSEQYPMDCFDQCTCEGGEGPADVMGWLSGVPGALSLADYPNGAAKYECLANSSLGVVKVNSSKEYALKTVAELKQSLVDHGPLSIGMCVNMMFQFYKGGILDPIDCEVKCDTADHYVVLIGYGKDKVDYWLLKNSFGTQWGEDGYARIVTRKCQVGSYIASSEVL